METSNEKDILGQKILDGLQQFCNSRRAQIRIILNEYKGAPEQYRQLGRLELVRLNESMNLDRYLREAEAGQWPQAALPWLQEVKKEFDNALVALQQEPVIAYYDDSARRKQKIVPMPSGQN